MKLSTDRTTDDSLLLMTHKPERKVKIIRLYNTINVLLYGRSDHQYNKHSNENVKETS